jgi:putative redox protein
MELILLGLGGCTGMDVVSILGKQRQSVEGFEINIDADRTDEHPKRYTEIRLEYVIYGDVDEKAVARAIELSETKYCSVMAMLGESAKIETTYRIEPDVPYKVGEPLDA